MITADGNESRRNDPLPVPAIMFHIDMDCFYASVEMRDTPDYTGRPVVVGADPAGGRGVVSACSYEARAFGIRSAMPIREAYRRCPHAVFLPPDIPRYAAVSRSIMEMLRTQVTWLSQVSIDEAYFTDEGVQDYPTARERAVAIKGMIRERFGITASVGVAPSRIVAKIASGHAKPDGLTVVGPMDVIQFLAPLQVGKIPGVGKKTESILHAMGIRTVSQLASADIQALIARFGRSGILLRQAACGNDNHQAPYHSRSRSLSREMTFMEDTNDHALLSGTLETLFGNVYQTLRSHGLRCRTVTIKVRYQGFVTSTRSKSLTHPTNDERAIRSAIRAIAGDIAESKKVRLLGLSLSGLEGTDACQRQLV